VPIPISSDKRNDCKQRSVLIEEAERQIEALYADISFAPDLRQRLEDWLMDEILEDRRRIRRGAQGSGA